MKVAVIIAAGGIGQRMGGDRPKQFLEVAGRPIICRTLDAFQRVAQIKELVVVLAEDYVASFKKDILAKSNFPENWQVTAGGKQRQDSVRNGLNLLSADCDVVLVHDAARPFITKELIEKAINTAYNKGAAILALPSKETVKRIGQDLTILETVDRQELWQAQTPQAFRFEVYGEAMEKAGRDNFLGTDDAMLVERLGQKVEIIEGDPRNIKITTPHDLVIAQAIAHEWEG